jgi:NitT/TauT family transport system substrate-binding protein
MQRSIIAHFSFFALSLALCGPMSAQTPRANGETINLQHYAGTTGNMHAVVAAKKGFCDRYNFKCELKIINSGILGLQTLIGKSIDVALTGTDLTASTIIAGGDVVIVGTGIISNVLFLAARSDVPMPSKPQGYPAVVRDMKGLKIGVPARGAAAEVYMNVMLRDAGLSPSDVTYVAVGGPQTAYTSMVVGKVVDAVIIFEPVKALCSHTKACTMVVDMTAGEGPKVIGEMQGTGVPLVMRRDFADGNPQLMAAFYAAMKDAGAWIHDPGNFEEVIQIYTPLISFGDMSGADELRRNWIKSAVATYSADLSVSRPAVEATLKFGVEAKTLARPISAAEVIWGKAP